MILSWIENSGGVGGAGGEDPRAAPHAPQVWNAEVGIFLKAKNSMVYKTVLLNVFMA